MRRTVAAELDVAPSPELTALIQPAHPRPAAPARLPVPARHNLPPAYNQFFGRARAQQEIHSRLDEPWCRLVTIVGQGGVGKTRLATTIARERLSRYPDGVWLVELADVDPEDDDLAEAIAIEIATAMDLRLSGSDKPTEQLLKHLQHQQALLVLDNFEHILEGVSLILEILQRCEAVQLLATSREALRIRAEWAIDLTGLDYPAGRDDETPSQAVDLFLARRAQQQRAPLAAEDQSAVRAICRMVEGLPLAIELAAALTRETPSRVIAEQLGRDFDRLAASMRDVPERHSSLQIVFEMSWRTLSPEVQKRLARLALFRGGFAPQAARQIAQAEAHHLAGLQEKSLLTQDTHTERYAIHPIVRAYAAAKRPADDPAPRKHAAFYLRRLADHAQPLQGSAPQHSVAALLPDLDNIRLAWQTGLAERMADRLYTALPALSTVYQLRGLTREAEAVTQAAVNGASEWGAAGAPLAIRAGLEQARFQNRLGRYRPALETVQRALAQAERINDPWAVGMGHILWGESLWRLGAYDAARQKLAHALAHAETLAGSPVAAEDVTLLLGWSHHHLGVIGDIQGRYAEALMHLERACDAWRAIDYAQALSNSLNSIGLVYFHQGNFPAAQGVMEQALAQSHQLDNRHLQSTLLNNLGIIAIEMGDHRAAQSYLQQGLELATASGNRSSQGEIYSNLGKIYNLLGNTQLAVDVLEKGLRVAETIGNRSLLAEVMFHLAEASRTRGDTETALSLYSQALVIAQQHDLRFTECEILLELAELVGGKDRAEARAYAAQAIALAATLQNPSLLQRSQALDSALQTGKQIT